MRFRPVMSITRPPPFCALSPYERPRPRAITPRVPPSAARATAFAMTSGSVVESTCATVGAVRPHPVRRWAVVGRSVENIVTRVPCRFGGSAQPEYHRALHDEVDHCRGALRYHGRDGYRPGPVVEELQAEVVQPALHDERQRVQHHDRDETRGAGRRLERPAAVDQVCGDRAGDKADRLGQVELQPDRLVQQHVEPEVDDRREPAGDHEPNHLSLERKCGWYQRLGHPGSLKGTATRDVRALRLMHTETVFALRFLVLAYSVGSVLVHRSD